MSKNYLLSRYLKFNLSYERQGETQDNILVYVVFIFHMLQCKHKITVLRLSLSFIRQITFKMSAKLIIF